MKRLLEKDPITGATETFEYDEDGDHIRVHRTGDTTPVLDHNKRLSGEWDGYNDDKTRRLAARIPIDVVYLWLTKYGVNVFDKNHIGKVNQLLDSNEFRYLRIGHFMLGNYS